MENISFGWFLIAFCVGLTAPWVILAVMWWRKRRRKRAFSKLCREWQPDLPKLKPGWTDAEQEKFNGH